MGLLSKSESPTFIHRRVGLARRGEHPSVIARLKSGWAVLGDKQVLRGYSLLLPDPVVPHLNALNGSVRAQFLEDMARLGDAILRVTGAIRINYEMLGNLEPALHAHVVPRYVDEPTALATRPVWFYDWDRAPDFAPDRDAGLISQIRLELNR